jgi:hypothetical protein
LTPTDLTPPLDTEPRIPLHFIKTELAAGVGAVTTGVTGSITLIETLSPYFKFAAVVMTVMVGIPTHTDVRLLRPCGPGEVAISREVVEGR